MDYRDFDFEEEGRDDVIRKEIENNPWFWDFMDDVWRAEEELVWDQIASDAEAEREFYRN